MNNLESHEFDEKKLDAPEKPSEIPDFPKLPIPPPPPAPDMAMRKEPIVERKQFVNISIDDLSSVQLKETHTKKIASKTFSAPPNRSVSMNNGIISIF